MPLKKIVRASIAAIALALALGPARADIVGSTPTLDIYFIDVEGGQSTLIVTPARQSLLVDTGYAGFGNRDPRRIVAAARAAGVTRIDYLLMTHFHPDHDGGVVELSRRMPIRTFVDHGDLERLPAAVHEPDWPLILKRYTAYVSIRAKGVHLEPRPGEPLPLRGADVTVVSAGGATISDPLPGGGHVTNSCSAPPPPDDAFENPRSTGFVLRFGQFRFLDLGDLTGEPLFALLCPKSLVGAVDVYLVPHHGWSDASYPATFAAFRPRVVIVNNGPVKGGSAEVFANLRGAPGLEAAWQLHRSEKAGVVNLSENHIANMGAADGFWIKVSARADGAFTVTNGRTRVTEAFAAQSRD